MISFSRLQMGWILIGCGMAVSIADDAATTPTPTDGEKQSRARELLEHLQAMTMEKVAGNGRQPVELIDRALLTYSDPVRANVHGTVWAWGREGRPLALVEVFQPTSGTQWVHAITLTSTDRVVATVSERQTWSPSTTGIQFQAIPSAAQPAERDVARLGQLKDFARKFDAHEFWDPDNSRYELRLLVQPIHRYRDPEHKTIDGAVFLLAHGTNPEVVLLIEAQGETVASSEWRYGLVRLGSAELHVELDGKEVWHEPRTPGVSGKPTDPYWLFFTEQKSVKK